MERGRKKGKEEWLLLAMFNKVILPAARNRRDDTKSAARVTQSKLDRWLKGRYMELWEEAIADTKQVEIGKKKRKPRKDERTQEQFNADRAKTLIAMGQYSRANQALMSHGMAENTEQTREALRNKHPQAQGPLEHEPREEGVEAAEVSRESVLKALKRFKRGSAPGLDGMRAEHLTQAVGSTSNTRQSVVLGNLTKLANVMLKGDIPDSVAPYVCGGRLHAALKKDGGIRPITVGNLLRRLVSRLAVMSVFDQAQQVLAPTQVGVGTRGGAESVIHALKRSIRSYPGLSTMQMDLINAYGEAERGKALDQVAEKFPQIYKWALRSYGGQNVLFYGGEAIITTKGWQQGDPLGPLMFALTLLPLTERIEAEVEGLKMHVWYLDNGHFRGTLDQFRQVLAICLEEGPAHGLTISRRGLTDDPKSEIMCPDVNGPDEPIGGGIPRVRDQGIIVLGSPVGTTEFERKIIMERIDKVEELTERLASLEDSHMELTLLRATLSLPKLLYVLRTVNPNRHISLWEHYDNITREGLGRIMAGTVSEGLWEESKLKISHGGEGLRSAKDHSIAAYTASVTGTWDLAAQLMGIREEELSEEAGQDRLELELGNELMDKLSEALGRPREDLTWEELKKMNQQEISVGIDARNSHLLKVRMERTGDERGLGRMRSLQQPNAGAWLCATPNPKTGMHLCSQDFVLCLKYRRGVPIFNEGTICKGCNKDVDILGEHAMNCRCGSGRYRRHDAIRDIIADAARAASLSPRVEARGLVEGSQQRPGDVLIPGYPLGRDLILDITIINPLQKSAWPEAAFMAGVAMERAKEKKRETYSGKLRPNQIFKPLAFETLGGFDRDSALLVKRISSITARNQGKQESEVQKLLVHRIAMSIQRFNAVCFVDRVDPVMAEELDLQE